MKAAELSNENMAQFGNFWHNHLISLGLFMLKLGSSQRKERDLLLTTHVLLGFFKIDFVWIAKFLHQHVIELLIPLVKLLHGCHCETSKAFLSLHCLIPSIMCVYGSVLGRLVPVPR